MRLTWKTLASLGSLPAFVVEDINSGAREPGGSNFRLAMN